MEATRIVLVGTLLTHEPWNACHERPHFFITTQTPHSWSTKTVTELTLRIESAFGFSAARELSVNSILTTMVAAVARNMAIEFISDTGDGVEAFASTGLRLFTTENDIEKYHYAVGEKNFEKLWPARSVHPPTSTGYKAEAHAGKALSDTPIRVTACKLKILAFESRAFSRIHLNHDLKYTGSPILSRIIQLLRTPLNILPRELSEALHVSGVQHFNFVFPEVRNPQRNPDGITKERFNAGNGPQIVTPQVPAVGPW